MLEADSATWLVLIVLTGSYAFAAVRLNRRPTPNQALAYAAGILTIALALVGALDRFAKERSFSVYIFQQMLLVFVAPPLLLAGVPDWMLRPLMMNRALEPFFRFITRPLIAFLTFASVFTLVHFPPVCDTVCQVHPFFGDVHTMLIVTGLLLWFPMLSPIPEYPRMAYPLQIMYLFLLMIPMTAVAAPITMAESVLYTFYAVSPHPFGLTPRADQVLGGLIMWVGQGVYLMFVFSAIFFRWARRDDTEIPPINRPASVKLNPHHS
jgi:putative membrane protein